MNHCNVRGSEAYCGDQSHIVKDEQGSAASIGGVTICPLTNKKDGTFDLKTFVGKLRINPLHEPISKLVVVENTINGTIVPQSWINDLSSIAHKYKIKMHLDGARLWHASIATGLSVKDLSKPFDTICCSLCKGLGAPIGSLLIGNKIFIDNARRTRKALGGGMRQVGILAAAGLVALDEMMIRLKDDHKHAKLIAQAILETKSKIFKVDLVQTNVVTVRIDSSTITAQDFIDRLEDVRDEDDNDLDDIVVRGMVVGDLARFFTYYEITDKLIEAAVKKIKYVIEKFDCES